MLDKTQGLFLNYIRYSDTSVIARIYTRKYGQQAYIVNGIRAQKAASKIHLFQPLFLLDMEIDYKPGRSLQRLKQVRLYAPFEQIPFQIKKSTQAMFLAEMLLVCLREEEPNDELFDFLFHAFSLLDLLDEGVSNFSVVFLLKLTLYLGVYPQVPDFPIPRFFDLRASVFTSVEPLHGQFLDPELTRKLAALFRADLSDMAGLPLNNYHRQSLLLCLIDYYKIHLDLSGDLKSLNVLKEVMGES